MRDAGHEVDVQLQLTPETLLEAIRGDTPAMRGTPRDAEIRQRRRCRILLSRLQATKAIFTNSPAGYARRVLQVLGIERHFSHIFDIRFSGFQPKPDPAVYQSVLDALNVAGHEALLVEDTAKNLAPARALGMTTILIGEASPDSTALADYVVPDVLAAIRVALELEQQN